MLHPVPTGLHAFFGSHDGRVVEGHIISSSARFDKAYRFRIRIHLRRFENSQIREFHRCPTSGPLPYR